MDTSNYKAVGPNIFVDPSTGELYDRQRQGDSENGFNWGFVPTGQTWEYMNTKDASGKKLYGNQNYQTSTYEQDGEGGWGSVGNAGYTPSGDIQIGQSLDRKGYTDVLNKYGIKPRYDPEYGYVLPASVGNAVTQEYFKNAGLGQYQERGGVTGFLDNYAVPLMMAATGAGMAGLGGVAATEAGAGAAAAEGTAGLATAETAAAAGDAYLPGALSNPFLQAMPTVSSMAQAAATNAAMQLATTGKIDPEKVLKSVVTSAAGSTAGNLAGDAAANALDSNLARSIVSGAVNGATQAGINGTDPMTAALASGAASGLGYTGKLNGINVPQQAINAVVSSVATGAPLEKTLLNAAMSMGVGAAKDAISGLSGTQAPAPVETRTPLSPDTSGLDSVSTDQGRTGTDALFYDEEGNALDASGNPVYGSHEDVLTEPVEPEGCQPPFVDDGTGRCILPEDKAAEDTPIPDCGPGMVWSLTDNACVPVEDVTKPVTTTVTPKTTRSTGTTGGTGTTGVPTKPPVTAPNTAVNSGQTQQNQQNALLMGLLLGEGQQAPQQQQQPVLAKIDPYDPKKDILGAAEYEKATQQPYAAGGSVHAINDELIKMLRS